MASADDARTLEEVKAIILSCHSGETVEEKVDFYTSWADAYDQDTDVLEYHAPRLAANCVAKHFSGDRQAALTLDVACGTGKASKQMKACGFQRFVGVDACQAMLKVAGGSDALFQELKLLLLPEEPLPDHWENSFDVVLMVGALSSSHVSVAVVKDLCKVSKPGGYICMTTRSNADNLEYKAALELELERMEVGGLWRRVEVVEVQEWERAVVEGEGPYIPGAIYLYQKLKGL